MSADIFGDCIASCDDFALARDAIIAIKASLMRQLEEGASFSVEYMKDLASIIEVGHVKLPQILDRIVDVCCAADTFPLAAFVRYKNANNNEFILKKKDTLASVTSQSYFSYTVNLCRYPSLGIDPYDIKGQARTLALHRLGCVLQLNLNKDLKDKAADIILRRLAFELKEEGFVIDKRELDGLLESAEHYVEKGWM